MLPHVGVAHAESTSVATPAAAEPPRGAFLQLGVDPMDFKGEAITFKATTGGVLSTLQHCADLVWQREEAWRRRLERELERRRHLEEQLTRQQEDADAAAAAAAGPGPESPGSAAAKRHVMFGGPDYQASPGLGCMGRWGGLATGALGSQSMQSQRLQLWCRYVDVCRAYRQFSNRGAGISMISNDLARRKSSECTLGMTQM